MLFTTLAFSFLLVSFLVTLARFIKDIDDMDVREKIIVLLLLNTLAFLATNRFFALLGK